MKKCSSIADKDCASAGTLTYDLQDHLQDRQQVMQATVGGEDLPWALRTWNRIWAVVHCESHQLVRMLVDCSLAQKKHSANREYQPYALPYSL